MCEVTQLVFSLRHEVGDCSPGRSRSCQCRRSPRQQLGPRVASRRREGREACDEAAGQADETSARARRGQARPEVQGQGRHPRGAHQGRGAALGRTPRQLQGVEGGGGRDQRPRLALGRRGASGHAVQRPDQSGRRALPGPDARHGRQPPHADGHLLGRECSLHQRAGGGRHQGHAGAAGRLPEGPRRLHRAHQADRPEDHGDPEQSAGPRHEAREHRPPAADPAEGPRLLQHRHADAHRPSSSSTPRLSPSNRWTARDC